MQPYFNNNINKALLKCAYVHILLQTLQTYYREAILGILDFFRNTKTPKHNSYCSMFHILIRSENTEVNAKQLQINKACVTYVT